MDKLKLALLRAGQFAQRLVEQVGRLLGYPLSLALRLLVNVLACIAPFFVVALVVLLPFVAVNVYKSIPSFDFNFYGIDERVFKSIIALGGFSLLFGMAVKGLIDWLKRLGCSLIEYLKKFPNLPPWFVGLKFREELARTDRLFDGTCRWLFRVLRNSFWALVAAASVGVLAAIVPLAPDPNAEVTKEVLILPSVPGCCGDESTPLECRTCPECPTCPELEGRDPTCPECPECPGGPICLDAFPDLEKDMEFVLLYPYYQKKTEQDQQKQWKGADDTDEDGVNLTVSNAFWLDIIKQKASACSNDVQRVKLEIRGFASDQPMSPPEDLNEAKQFNCGVANARGRAVVNYLEAKNVTWKHVQDKEEWEEWEEWKVSVTRCDDTQFACCESEESDVEQCGQKQNRQNGSPSFDLNYQPWCNLESMVNARNTQWPEAESLPDRQRFRHRSVLIVVKDAGTCGGDS